MLEVSALEEMPSMVATPDGDVRLSEIMATPREPDAVFPLLVKRLDVGQPLSIQVHPDDADALRLEGESNGKKEAWIVLDADEGASVLLGFREGVTRDDVEAAAGSEAIVDLMRRVPVVRGDPRHEFRALCDAGLHVACQGRSDRG